MTTVEQQFGREFSLRSYPPYIDRKTCQWLYFTEGRKGDWVSFTPEGKVIFPDRDSEIVLDRPGEHLAARVTERGKVAFAKLIRFHGSAEFSRQSAFGSTRDGNSVVSSHQRRPRIRLGFVCNPEAERFELLDYDCYRWETPDGTWKYLEFRHGLWRVVNFGLPHLMPDDPFRDAERRMWGFGRQNIINFLDSSNASNWSAALAAGVVNKEEYEEAYRRHARLWHYAGT